MKSISAQLIEKEAKKMWYTIEVISDELDIFTIKDAHKKILFKNIDCWVNDSLGVRFSRYKTLSYFMLWLHWIKVPKSIVVKKWLPINSIMNSIKDAKISFPLVIKPTTWEHWNGVSVNISTKEAIKKAIKHALSYHHQVIIQEFFPWKDHRLLVIGHKFIAAMNRIPAFIIGDGKYTIKDIIRKENMNPLRGEEHDKSLTRISIDAELKNYIASQWLTLDSILPKNKKMFVRKNANLSTWWISVDITDQVHPTIKRMAEKASKILWLQVCGIDYLSQDITKPLHQQTWWIIEVNHTPWLRWHHFPAVGKSRNAAKAILQLAFKK